MTTKIDSYLQELHEHIISVDRWELPVLQSIMDRILSAYQLDVVYVLKRISVDNGFQFCHVSASRQEYDISGRIIHLTQEGYERALHMYDGDRVSTEHLRRKEIYGKRYDVVHFGYVRGDVYDGSVGFRVYGSRKWTVEEREALRKFGRLYRYIMDEQLTREINQDLQRTLLEERKHRRIIDSLGSIYNCVYLFSLKKMTYQAIRQTEEMKADIARKGTIDDFTRIYADKFVDGGFVRDFNEFADTDSIRRRLLDTDSFSVEYKRIGCGWCRGTIIVSKRGREREPEELVFAVQTIEGEKQKELDAKAALQDAYEAANRANAAKTDFLSNMSHDIRTPMNAIIGMTAIAGAHLDDKERVTDCLSKITVSSKHLLALINEILDMSKIESGRVDLAEEEFDLSVLVDDTITMCRTQIERKNHRLKVDIHDVAHEKVVGDSLRLQQVFMNLMSNAIKYTPDGGTIRVAITEKPMRKPLVGCYEFIFEDNGIGMSPESLKHLFEPFWRGDDKRVTSVQGTGLGMPITSNIVHMMNGDIEVDSELDVGTRFTVTVYLKLQNEEAVSYEEFLDLSVLVADDEEESCVGTCEILNELGMDSEWVLSGQDAVERVVERHEKEEDYFAVILDWRMPGMDGVETTREIRRRVGEDVPIIILSAYDWSDVELEARAAGANAFIGKPLFKSRLVHLFSSLVKHEDKEEKSNPLQHLEELDCNGRRVLLVEDNELNSEIAEEILRMARLEVECAKDGREAVNKVAASPEGYYDLVFMDIQMPIMDGYEAARAIRSLDRADAYSIPIVAMTANAFAQDIHAAENAGMNEHIAKPLDFQHLLKVLEKYL